MDGEFIFCENIIYKLAHKHAPRFHNTMYDFDDLVSEGWIVYLDCNKKRDKIKNKFTSYLYSAVDNKFKSLYINECLRLKKKHEKVPITEGFDKASENLSPEKTAMAIQAMVALSEVSYDFATMIVNGVPKDLLFVARRHMRAKKIGNNLKGAKDTVVFTRKMLEIFFNVNLDELKEIASQYF